LTDKFLKPTASPLERIENAKVSTNIYGHADLALIHKNKCTSTLNISVYQIGQ
jgi:hypothetical protein